MRRNRIIAALMAALMMGFAATVIAQPRIELGKREFMSNCAVCHGVTGKGDGSYFELLKVRVPDITTITERNKGKFPSERIYQIIDGREMPKAHGAREMPIWGYDYKLKAADFYIDSPYDPEIFIRVRILALIDFLHSLQSYR